MTVKNYGIRDQWTDLDKLNIVDIKSVDGVIESVKINGEEAGSGGGSDFSTAEVTLINNYEGSVISLMAPIYVDSEEISTLINYIDAQPNETITPNAVLYKNSCFAEIRWFEQLVDPKPLVTVSGNVVYEGNGFFIITGDCTITIS